MRGRQPDPTSRTRRAAAWLRVNPEATPKIAGEMHGVTAGAVRTAWCRMFPGSRLLLRERDARERARAEHRAYLEAA